MKDLLSSRGFWVMLNTILATIAVQFPETEPWVNVLVPLVAALASYFGVALTRRMVGAPASYAKSEQEKAALVQLRRIRR